MAKTTVPIELSSTPSIVDNGNATAITIDSSENVGIGVTPENSSGTWRNLQFGGGNLVFRSSGANDAMIGTGYLFKTDNSEVYKNTEAVSRLFFDNSSMIFQQAGSGTAGTAISWSEAMRINASGNVGINTNNPTAAKLVISDTGSNKISLDGGTSQNGIRWEAVGGANAFYLFNGTFGTAGFGVYNITTTAIPLWIQNGGNIGINKTSPSAKLDIVGAASASASQIKVGTNGYPAINFLNAAGAQQGYIVTNASSVSYTSISDYRLKENVTYDWDATTRLKQLKPARFNFIHDADTTIDGFLAHEVSSIVPEATLGEKDEMQTEEYEVTPAVLDDDGNVVTEAVMGTREVPKYQGIDQSKLVPLLVKTIQELEARITALEGN